MPIVPYVVSCLNDDKAGVGVGIGVSTHAEVGYTDATRLQAPRTPCGCSIALYLISLRITVCAVVVRDADLEWRSPRERPSL